MADLFGYKGVTPPMVFGQPTDAMGAALYNSGLLANYTPLDSLQPNPWQDPNAPKEQKSGEPPTDPKKPPTNPNNALNPNSYWRQPPGALGENPTWQFIPGMGVIPVKGIGQIPPMPTNPPIDRGGAAGFGGLGPNEQFMLGVIMGLMSGNQSGNMMRGPGFGMTGPGVPVNGSTRAPLAPPPSGAFQDAKMPSGGSGQGGM